jgi:hypothetical protein
MQCVERTVLITKFFEDVVADLENSPSIKQHIFQIYKQFVTSLILSIYHTNFPIKS